MKRAIITVGLGFGDEGKGATVDFLARHYAADLVVRYCGGSQAGHNVELTTGHRHTFSQFAAGTFALPHARTYLGPNVVIDPPALVRESAHLAELGVDRPFSRLIVHPRCLVTTFWHRRINQLRELARGVERHGSCGQGIGESRSYWLRHGEDAVFAADLRDPVVLRHKLELLRQRMLLELQVFAEQLPSAGELRDLWLLQTEQLADDLAAAFSEEIRLATSVPECTTAIFEGAQGVLLDEYRGFHPHTTWSTVTPHHALELVQQMSAQAVAVLGITRTYTTRHGAGPLPTFSPVLTDRLHDPGNPVNAWQGGMRRGWLDLPLLRYASGVVGELDGLVVNHLDEVREGEWLLCDAYAQGELQASAIPNLAWQSQLTKRITEMVPRFCSVSAEDVVWRLSEIAPVVLTGTGPTHQDRRFTGMRFRDPKTGDVHREIC